MTGPGQITGTIDNADNATNANNINVDEKNDPKLSVLFSDANGTSFQRPYIDTDDAHFTYNPSTHASTVGTIEATTLTQVVLAPLVVLQVDGVLQQDPDLKPHMLTWLNTMKVTKNMK